MENFIKDVEAFAAKHEVSPERVLKDAINAEWGRWSKWKAGSSSPTIRTIDRVRAYITEAPSE